MEDASINNDDNLSAMDVIRCVYLARLARRRGDHESAQRWQAKADEWLARQKGCFNADEADPGKAQAQ